MPPKKDKKEKDVQKEPAERGKSEKEIILQKQLDGLVAESMELRSTLEKLRRDCHFLGEQANQSIEEATDYSLYMRGEAERRQNLVISVNQQNRNEIQRIEQESKKGILKIEKEKSFKKNYYGKVLYRNECSFQYQS